MNAAFGTKETSLPFGRFLLAGLCGGVAEMLWVALYSTLTPVSGMEVARQVTATVFPAAANLPWAPEIGMAIHLLLSLALGVAFGAAIWAPFARDRGAAVAVASAVAALVTVWALNFFVVLPALHSAFVSILPYAVTLISKALFGVSMGWILEARRRNVRGDSPVFA